MHKRLIAAPAALAAAGVLAAAALSSAPPVGPLPNGPVQTVKPSVGATFTLTLAKPGVAGRVWRVARAYDSSVVREVGEATRRDGSVRVTYRAVGAGATSLVYALTQGERSHAYAARTVAVVVAGAAGAARCPHGLLALTANPLGPAVAAALRDDAPQNRPQATSATIATYDTVRGSQVKARCGKAVQARTVVVYVTDRAFLPSQSASQRVVFVGRTSAGYRVWERAH